MEENIEIKENEKEKQRIDRFNHPYEEPRAFLKEYLKGNITLYNISKNCLNGRIPIDSRAIILRIPKFDFHKKKININFLNFISFN